MSLVQKEFTMFEEMNCQQVHDQLAVLTEEELTLSDQNDAAQVAYTSAQSTLDTTKYRAEVLEDKLSRNRYMQDVLRRKLNDDGCPPPA